YTGGLGGLCLALSLIFVGTARRTLVWLVPLIPLLGIAASSFYSSLDRSAGGIAPFALTVESYYILRIYSFGFAALILFLLAASQDLFKRRTWVIPLGLILFAWVEVFGVGIEILGTWVGKEWHPFLGMALIESEAGELKTAYFGSLGNTNFLAGYLAMLFFPVLPALSPHPSLNPGKEKTRSIGGVFRWALPLLLLGAILACRSKGALLGLLFGAAIYFIAKGLAKRSSTLAPKQVAHRWRGRGAVATGGVVVVLLLASSLLFFNRSVRNDWTSALSLRGESISKRVLLAYTGLHMLSDSPWVGIGPGSFRLQFLESVGEILETEAGEAFRSRVQNLKAFKPVHVHNDPLEVLVEWGIVGYASILLFILSVLVSAIAKLRADPPGIRARRLGWIAGFCAALGYSLFEFPFHLAPHLALASVLLGLSIASASTLRSGGFRWSILPGIGIAFLLSLFLLYQGVSLGLASHLAQAAWANP
ncbi:MAG: O-antigen ligase family protein, partial [Candidatus Omnitrophica bacterium]|nr:O-antigen ligase family protein [Candidatus Omnitrophota bacterium]